MMSKGHTLRALVNARLAAAADEIFALFERTIAEYEEELCQRKQELVSGLSSARLKADDVVQIPNWSPDLVLNQEMTPVIKEEPEELSIKPKVEHQQELSSVCVKREESSLLQQNEQTQREDNLERHLHPEEDRGHTSDHDEDWGAPFSWSDVETEAGGDEKEAEQTYGDHCYQGKMRDTSPAEPNYSLYSEINVVVNDEDLPGTAAESEQKKYLCFFCTKRFKTKQERTLHERIHTGEKPFNCSFCEKTFAQKSSLQSHERIHTGERPFSCPTCHKAFAHKGNLRVHIRKHTGEKPFCCSVCGKDFADSSTHKKHMESHLNKDAKTAMRLNRLLQIATLSQD